MKLEDCLEGFYKIEDEFYSFLYDYFHYLYLKQKDFKIRKLDCDFIRGSLKKKHKESFDIYEKMNRITSEFEVYC